MSEIFPNTAGTFKKINIVSQYYGLLKSFHYLQKFLKEELKN